MILRPIPSPTCEDLAGRQHLVEAQHEVARVAVSGSDQRPAAGADPASDQRARVRSRIVGVDQPVPRQLLVELEHVDAGADRAGAVVQVDLVDLVHPLDVDDDPAAQRDRSVGEPGPAVTGHDRDQQLGSRSGRPRRPARCLGQRRRDPGTRSAQRCTGNGAGTRARLYRSVLDVRICSAREHRRSAAITSTTVVVRARSRSPSTARSPGCPRP